MVKQDYRARQRIAQWLKTLVKGGLYVGSAIMSHMTLAMLFNLSEIYFPHLNHQFVGGTNQF